MISTNQTSLDPTQNNSSDSYYRILYQQSLKQNHRSPRLIRTMHIPWRLLFHCRPFPCRRCACGLNPTSLLLSAYPRSPSSLPLRLLHVRRHTSSWLSLPLHGAALPPVAPSVSPASFVAAVVNVFFIFAARLLLTVCSFSLYISLCLWLCSKE